MKNQHSTYQMSAAEGFLLRAVRFSSEMCSMYYNVKKDNEIREEGVPQAPQ